MERMEILIRRRRRKRGICGSLSVAAAARPDKMCHSFLSPRRRYVCVHDDGFGINSMEPFL